jgi:hypothetical protein
LSGMETPAQRCGRLVAALDDLAAQEAVALHARRFEEARAVQNRAAPLVDFLVACGVDVADDALRSRVSALLLRRNQTDKWLADQIERVRAELQQSEETQRRLAQVAPAYGRSGTSFRRQLKAVG